jgi:hypothetical protein
MSDHGRARKRFVRVIDLELSHLDWLRGMAGQKDKADKLIVALLGLRSLYVRPQAAKDKAA